MKPIVMPPPPALPTPLVDPALPIAGAADEIVALLVRHQVVVVAGETGSGKTTQLPKLCLAAGRGSRGMIGCTQPRRIAARAVARRVAEELQVPMGGAGGYQVRFNDQVGEQTVVKFMTDGILLAEIQRDRMLARYDTIIVDEAHERSLNIDFLLGYLKRLLPKRRDLKLIVTSATIDTARFAEHFGGAPVVEVSFVNCAICPTIGPCTRRSILTRRASWTPATATSCTGRSAATRPASPWSSCTAVPAAAVRRRTGASSTRRPTGSSCSTSAGAGVRCRTRPCPVTCR